jgi:putative heme-binding domain-containing protein
MEINRLLEAFAGVTNEAVGLRLVAALKETKGQSGVRVDLLKQRLAEFPATVQKEGEALLAALDVDLAGQAKRLDQMVGEIKGGDIRRGQEVFNSTKTACVTCHMMGYLGGKVGPDLTSIGQIRTERDLLEAILYPSASFVRSYEPVIVTAKDAEEYGGVIRSETADEVVLVTGPETVMHLARENIAEIRPGALSIMPTGLDEQLTKQELADLVAFLKNAKWGAQ